MLIFQISFNTIIFLFFLSEACNILVNGDSGVFTLRNHGTRSNCSLAAVYPASISLLQLNVGVPAVRGIRRAESNRFIETGVLHRVRCVKMSAQSKRNYADNN